MSPSDPSPAAHGELVLSLHATVLDIGIAGLAIETENRLTPQRSLGMRIGSESGVLTLTGQVVWCFFHGTATAPSGEQMPVYRAGIEFADVLTPQASELLRFLEAHAVVSVETRLFGRFRLEEGGPVAVHSTAPVQIVAVSATELEVEADLGVEPCAGMQVTLRLAGDPRSTLATVTSVGRAQSGAWRLSLSFEESQPALLVSASALLAAG